MPRRSPSEIRARLPVRRARTSPGRTPQIRGLSAAATRQIADFERTLGLHPGEVAGAFRAWAYRATGPQRKEMPWYISPWHGHDAKPSSGDYHARSLLEQTLHALRPRARRELRAAIEPLDARVYHRTVNNPYAYQDLPWWLRRYDM